MHQRGARATQNIYEHHRRVIASNFLALNTQFASEKVGKLESYLDTIEQAKVSFVKGPTKKTDLSILALSGRGEFSRVGAH